jgi:hypothetical protein
MGPEIRKSQSGSNSVPRNFQELVQLLGVLPEAKLRQIQDYYGKQSNDPSRTKDGSR